MNQFNGSQGEFGTESQFWTNSFNQPNQQWWGYAPRQQAQTWTKDPTNWSMWAGGPANGPGFDANAQWWQTNGAQRATWNGFDRANVFCPAMSVSETSAAFMVWCELPGVSDKDINLSWFNGTLSIRGQKQNAHAAHQGEVWASDQFWGHFFRSISFAQFAHMIDSNKISTKFVNGVLEVTLPKSTPATGTQIKVGSGR